jgi:acetyl esterase
MPLHPDARAVLDLVAAADNPPYWSLTPVAARAQHEEKAPVLDARPLPVAQCDDRDVPGPGGAVPIRLYFPDKRAELAPALLWLHGGGHVVGSVASYDALCRVLAVKSGCAVVSVDYRLAPEHKFPAAVEDAFAVLRWLLDQGRALGIDPARLAVGGDSAGANLAAVSAILARDAGLGGPVFQLLIYPATAPWPDSGSHQEFAEGHLLDRRTIDWFQNHYARGAADRRDFRFAPLLASDLSRLPPALVIVAECDPLRDEGTAYAERLRDAGVPVELSCYAGMIHAFVSLSRALEGGRRAIDQAATALARALVA